MKSFPNTAEELLEALDNLIPEPTPRPGDSHDKMLFDAGRRSVVLEMLEWRHRGVPAVLRDKRGAGRRVSR